MRVRLCFITSIQCDAVLPTQIAGLFVCAWFRRFLIFLTKYLQSVHPLTRHFIFQNSIFDIKAKPQWKRNTTMPRCCRLRPTFPVCYWIRLGSPHIFLSRRSANTHCGFFSSFSILAEIWNDTESTPIDVSEKQMWHSFKHTSSNIWCCCTALKCVVWGIFSFGRKRWQNDSRCM